MDSLIAFFSEKSFTLIKCLSPAFMAILFLQSGFDKVFNYKDNLVYFTDHFKNSPLSNTVPLLMPIMTVLEVIAGLLCATGTVALLRGNEVIAYWGLMVAAISFLCLFFGQRLAKDYAGAVSLASYFIIVVVGLLMLS
jgi:uncharacterized membrane protein YphA (DoxX/SURF4 family)